MDIKLSIGIHEKSQIFADCLKAANQGRAISLVHRVVNDFQAWISRGNGIQDRAGVILTSIVNDDDFMVYRPIRQSIDDVVYSSRNYFLFVMRRQNH